MVYVFQRKFNIDELASIDQQTNKVLVVEPEKYLGDLYKHYLTESFLDVLVLDTHDQVRKTIGIYNPNVILLNVDAASEKIDLLLAIIAGIRREYPILPIVSIAHNLNGDFLIRFMNKGITSHIDRAHTRPADVVCVIKTLINNN